MADVQRFQEAISSYVLDAGESISYRSLASQVGGESASRAEALAQFYQQNGDGVGAMHVVVEHNISSAKKMDPRARVVRLSTSSENSSQVYGVYPSSLQGAEVMEAMALALWAQERKIRNDLFAKTSRHAPLTRELRAFYESDVHCAAATSRSDVSGSQGEEAVTMFDSIKSSAHTSSGRNTQMQGVSSSSSSSSSKPSLFKNSSGAATSSTTTAKSTSFFKSSSTATSAKPKTASSTASKSKTPVSQPDTKRIDANAMSNVFTIDSDDDEDGSDEDNAPKFVKAVSTQKPRSKRVMISDDEDDDDDDDDGFEQVSPPPQKDTARATATKRKLSASPERPAKQVKQSKAVEKKQKAESPKRKRAAEKEEEGEEEETVEAAEEEANDQPQAEEDTLPTGPIKRRVAVTKTTINELGYMVTEKVYEDVEVSAEDLAKERAEAKKKQAAAQAAAAAQKARAAAAASKAAKTDKASAGPAKQKKLDFFFTRK